MKKFHIFIFSLIVVLPACFLLTESGCKPGETMPTLVVSSRLWSQPYEREFLLNDIIKPFEEQNKCRVRFEVFDDEKLLQRAEVQERTRNYKTDVVIVYVSKMPQWVELGYLQDLTTELRTWSDRSFMKSFQKMTTFDGKQYFMPIGADDYLLCANKKALKYLPEGTDIQKITWQQLVTWAKIIAHKEGKGKFAVTGVPQKMLIYQIGCAILAYGGDFPDLASPKAVEAWKLLVNLKGTFAPSIQTYDTVIPAMKRGEAWLAVTHNARVGEIYASNSTEFVIAPVPSGPAGRGSVVGVSGLALTKNAPQRELGVKFIKYLTRPDVQVQLAKGTGGFIPTVEESLKQFGNSTRDEVIKKSMIVLNEGKLAYIPPCRDWGAVKMLFDDTFHDLVIKEGKVDKGYLKKSQQKLTELLSQTK